MPSASRRTRETYISVDVEASGPSPGDFSLLAIGACQVAKLDITFYIELKPISTRFVPDALDVARLSMTELAEEGVEPASAMSQFASWVKTAAADAAPVMVAFNATFDWAFINWYFIHFGIDNPFGIGAVDIKSYYMGMSGARWSQTRSSALPTDLRPRRLKHTHNALDDAVEQAQIFARMRTKAQS